VCRGRGLLVHAALGGLGRWEAWGAGRPGALGGLGAFPRSGEAHSHQGAAVGGSRAMSGRKPRCATGDAPSCPQPSCSCAASRCPPLLLPSLELRPPAGRSSHSHQQPARPNNQSQDSPTPIPTPTLTLPRTHTHAHTHIHADTHTQIYTHTQTHTHMKTHTHTHAHTHTTQPTCWLCARQARRGGRHERGVVLGAPGRWRHCACWGRGRAGRAGACVDVGREVGGTAGYLCVCVCGCVCGCAGGVRGVVRCKKGVW